MALRDWTIVRILTGIATKIWAASFAALLACFILYCFYGGLMAFSLLIAAVSGNFKCRGAECALVIIESFHFPIGILYQTQDNLLYHPEQPPHSRVFIPVPSMFGKLCTRRPLPICEMC